MQLCSCMVQTFLGFIPVCSLGLSQVGRINLGQNVSSLRYFTICGLQEGFEPFAINMKRDITMWFSKSLPQFNMVPTDHPHIEVLSFACYSFLFEVPFCPLSMITDKKKKSNVPTSILVCDCV